MRKSEREISDLSDKFETLLRCEYLTLALQDEAAPYALPVNFGAELEGDKLTLYFHCAVAGKKLELLQKDARVGFCAARQMRVFNKGVAPCGYTTDYESVCGRGRAEILTDRAERLHGLKVLTSHYTPQKFADGDFNERAFAITTVVKITVDEWTGKRLYRPEFA